jgi:hypothetical protein
VSAAGRATIAAAALVALAACRRQERPQPAPLPLSPAALGRATYVLGSTRLDTLTLADGQLQTGDGRLVRLLPVMTWGDLTADDRREAAAIVVTQTPAGDAFTELVVVQEIGGRPVQVAHQYLGNRVAVEGLAIADRVVAAQFRAHGPADPPCCPSERRTQRLRVGAPGAGAVVPAGP